MTDGRETAGLTIRLIIEYIRRRHGDDGVTELLRLAGEARPLEVLEDERIWSTYDQKIALFAAAAEMTGTPGVARSIGETVIESSVGSSLQVALGILGSPSVLLRTIARANGKFATIGAMRAEQVTSTGGTIRYRVKDGYALSHFDCDYTMGLLSQVPALFDLPSAMIEHPQCQVTGASECVYHLRWRPRSRFGRRHGDSVAGHSLLGRLKELQATLSDLVATTEVEEVLDTIALRAGSAVNAERFLLAIRLHPTDPPQVRCDGFSGPEADNLAEDLLSGGPVELAGNFMLDTEVRTSTRSYGRLAAFARYEFLEHEAELLASYAGLAATALEAVTALAEAEQRRHTAEALLGLASELHRADTVDRIADAVSRAARAVVGSDVAATLLFDDSDQALRLVGQAGWPANVDPRPGGMRIGPRDTAELERLLCDPDSPRIYGDDCQDPFLRQLLRTLRTRLISVVSIQGDNRVHGVLLAGWLTGSANPVISDPLFARLRALADQATNALDKLELIEQVKRQATSDPLTGIANRRMLNDRLEEVVGRPTGEDCAALLFLDLDGFKQVNDTLGHASGDELLREVANRLRRSVRADDLVARLGGDEFTVLLSAVGGVEAALAKAEQVMAEVARPVRVGGELIDVRCSVGVVLVDSVVASASDVLSDADSAMYDAKRSGGSRCSVYVRSGPPEVVLQTEPLR